MSRLCLIAVALLALGGCAQVRGTIVAENLAGPVSLSGSLLDAQGRILTLDDGLEQVGQFETSTRFLATFYGLALPTWSWDASEYLNQLMQRYGGEGIVELVAEVEEPNGGEILLAYFSQTTPFTPIWIKVNLEGKVVRRSEAP